MSRQRSQLGSRMRVGSRMRGAALGLVAAATALSYVLLSPTAGASPESDAQDAITAAWEANGGAGSRLGTQQGAVYSVGGGFAADYTGGKIFFTPDTGARAMYGPILDKYETAGGPDGSDLGFPDSNQTTGLAGPDSQFIEFGAVGHPLIFFTPEHGAFVVRGPINAAWDTLHSSAGPLGPPAGDETFAGDVVSQKFAAGELSWNRKTNSYATVPAELADQLADLHFEVNPTGAINAAWRATGGATGPLGARQGDQQAIGDDGQVQDFAGGKVFFTPATGANAVEGPILEKYESLGGPLGSDLGFPTANPTDAGLGPDSQLSAFGAADQPKIFWSSEHGAFVVRGAMMAAWEKLGGAGGDLGAPLGDQSVDGDLVQQKFADGTISWNQAENRFTTEPAHLASTLSGLQVPGLGAASAPTTGAGAAGSWHWWWLPVSIGVLLLAGLLAWAARGWRRGRGGLGTQPPARETSRPVVAGRAPAAQWAPEAGEDAPPFGESFFDLGDPVPSIPSAPEFAEPTRPEFGEPDQPSRVAWAYRAGTAELHDEEEPVTTGFDADDLRGYGHPDHGYDHQDGYEDHQDHEDHLDHGDDHGDYEFGGYPAGSGEYSDQDSDNADTGPIHLGTASRAETTANRGRHAADEVHDEVQHGGYWAQPEEAVHEVTAEVSYAEGSYEGVSYAEPEADLSAGHPAMHLPLTDPYQAPAGYPIKANTVSGLYYTPDNALYHDTLAEIWFATEAMAQANGFVRAE